MNYHKKYLKYKAKYLSLNKTLYNQEGGDVLTSQYRDFIGNFRELQNVAVNNNDDSFIKVNDKYISDLMQLVKEEKVIIDKKIKATTIEEKKVIGETEEIPLKLKFDELKKDINWNKFNEMKNEFYSIQDLSAWVIEHYKLGNIKRVEDIKSRLKPAYDDFKWLIKEGHIEKNKKVSGFKGLIGLEDFLSKPIITQKLQEKRKGEKGIMESRTGGEIIYDGKDIKIIHPTTKEGSCHYGKGTKWCTAATQGENKFEYYDKKGPLYIIQPKKPEHENEKYQLHFESDQFVNEKDAYIDLYELYKKYPEIENIKNDKLYTHLLGNYLSYNGYEYDIEIVKSLISKGADINAKNRNNSTVLNYAVQNIGPDSLKHVEFLVNNGADVNVKNYNGETILSNALSNSSPYVFEIVDLLINKGANVNHRHASTSLTILHYATRLRNSNAFKIVELLVNKGADVNVKDKYGETPLFEAVVNKNLDILKTIEIFLNKGADVNVKNKKNETILMKILQNKDPNTLKIVNLLLNKGADVNVKNNKNETILMYAVKNTGPDALEIQKLLKDHGAK